MVLEIGLLLGGLALHLVLVIKQGISDPPVPGRRVDPRTEDSSRNSCADELDGLEPELPTAAGYCRGRDR